MKKVKSNHTDPKGRKPEMVQVDDRVKTLKANWHILEHEESRCVSQILILIQAFIGLQPYGYSK